MVCLSHLLNLSGMAARHSSSLGPLGVRIFFVISGMLITRLLVDEYERAGSISLRAFYIRRTIRIFPAMWFYVAVMAALAAAGIIALHRHDIIYALTYSINYFPGRSWYLGHIWSLSVEEQFYLLWPLALCLATPKHGVKIALLAIAFAPLLRFLILLFTPAAQYYEWFPTTCDSLATGCLLSLLPEGSEWKQRATRIAMSRWFVLIPVLILLISSLRHRSEGMIFLGLKHRVLFMAFDTIGALVMNFCIALVLVHVVMNPADLAGRFLNARPVVWLGRISYSLYLWQMPFLNRDASSWITRTPVNLIAAVAAACVSYYLVENPLLELRKRMKSGEPRRAPQRKPENVPAVNEVAG
jgi:peptidoglycan/LPS O-acetylase OafA/YrhL